MTISIVLATYNGERFLREQLESLRLQTRPADEVIIQDDGSTDGTVQLVQDYIQEHELSQSWKFTLNKSNLGYIENFKTGTVRAQGDIICFCDQDDLWTEDRLSITEQVFVQNPQVDVMCCRYSSFVSGENVDTSVIHDTKGEIYDGELEKIPFQFSNLFLASLGCAMAFRKQFVLDNLDYWYTGFAHDEFVWKIALCTQSLYWYRGVLLQRRHHDSNVSMRKMRNVAHRVAYLEKLLKSYQTMQEFLIAHQASDEQLKIVKKQIKAVELREALFKKKKYFNAVKLFFGYRKTYQTLKTIPLELYMSLFRKKFS